MAELRTIELPPHLEEMVDVKELDRVSDLQMQRLEDDLEDLEDNILIQTSTEEGISRREKILGIVPLDTQSLQLRRDNVMLAWFDIYPYTRLDLQRRLDLLCGKGNSAVEYDAAAQTMTVSILLVTKERKSAIEEMLERIAPLMIIFNVEILYHCWDEFRRKTWNELRSKTWEDVKEAVEE